MHGTQASVSRSAQIRRGVFNQNRSSGVNAFVSQNVTHQGDGWFGTKMSMYSHLFDAPTGIKAVQDVQVFHDGARVAQGCVGHEDFSSRETPQFLCEAAFCTNQRGDVKVMTAMKELMRIDTVMAHQTDQGCTVSFPVRRSELIGCFLIDRKAFHDGSGHS